MTAVFLSIIIIIKTMINLLNQNSTREDFNFYVKKAKALRFKEQFPFHLSEIIPILIADEDDVISYITNKFDELSDYYIESGEMTMDEITMNKVIADFARNDYDSTSSNYVPSVIFDSQDMVLNKDSDIADIRSYFEVVKSIRDDGKKFPIDLDTVWMMLYSRKEKAVNDLKRNYTQNVDYQQIHQMGKRRDGECVGMKGVIKYYLSIDAFEFFIANKKRDVFNVYKEIFWAVTDGKINTTNQIHPQVSEAIGKMADIAVLHNDKLLELEARIGAMEKSGTEGGPRYPTKREPSQYQKEIIEEFAKGINMEYDYVASFMLNNGLAKKGRNAVILPKAAMVRKGYFCIGMRNGEERLEFTVSGTRAVIQMIGIEPGSHEKKREGVSKDEGLNFV